ncbi:hypothetical protein CHUAL_013539 [Chamberlinius hualienensis]
MGPNHGPPSALPLGPPPPGLSSMIRPPRMQPGFPPPVRLPSGRPMGPPGLPQGLPPCLLGPPPVRLPPGPPTEDPEQYKDMKHLETDYETKRKLLMQHYESVKYAQQVQIEDNPLPSMQMPTSTVTAKTTAPPPPGNSNYSYRPFISAAPAVRPRIPPDVPPGPC